MRRHHRIPIEIAVQILRAAVDISSSAKIDTIPVRLALRVLLPHCPERWPLTQFWTGINGTHEIGRAQTVTASFNGIVHQLEASGAMRKR